MNTFTPSFFNDSIPLFDNTSSFQNREIGLNQHHRQQAPVEQPSPRKSDLIINMNDGKPPADEFGIGGGAKGNMVPLPLDFVPGNFDVLCGRGKKNYNSLGNQRLRRIVDSYVEQYSAATSRQDKSDILSAIVNEVRSASPDGGFIKQDPVTERWFEVGDFLAREKVSQAFRDALSSQYRSSKKFKHEKRRQRDKAAKLAKQKGLIGKDDEKKPKGKASSSSAKPLLRRNSLSVLREEPSTPATHPFANIGPGGTVQANRPARAMSLGGQAMPPLTSQSQGSANQPGIGDQMPALTGYGFGGSSDAGNQGMQAQDLGSRHTSWPQLFPNTGMNNPMFNPMNPGGAAAGMSSNMAMAQRRFSDAMITDANQAPFHFQQQSDNWQQQMNRMGGSGLPVGAAALHASFPGAGSSSFPGAGSALPVGAAALHASFPGAGSSSFPGAGLGMGMHHNHPHAASGVGMPGMGGSMSAMDPSGMMAAATMGMPPLQQQQQQQQQQPHQQGDGNGSSDHSHRSHSNRSTASRRQPPQAAASMDEESNTAPVPTLQRSTSAVSTAGTAIVERLESSFSKLPQDDNPFEPVPLPQERAGGAGSKSNHNSKANNDDDDDASIQLDW